MPGSLAPLLRNGKLVQMAMMSIFYFSLCVDRYRHHSSVSSFLSAPSVQCCFTGRELCVALFSSIDSVRHAVSSLVSIALNHDLDGWLINIENTLPMECLENVIIFLQLLTKGMHEACGVTSQVIWYDAVTTEGNLQWQDSLSILNKSFFDACDAIFINYTWTEFSLVQTHSLLEVAPCRCPADVYYGVDVYGRGTLGGGGYNCSEALHYICHSKSDGHPTNNLDSSQEGTQEDTPANKDKISEEKILSGQKRQGPREDIEGDRGEVGFSVALFAPGAGDTMHLSCHH